MVEKRNAGAGQKNVNVTVVALVALVALTGLTAIVLGGCSDQNVGGEAINGGGFAASKAAYGGCMGVYEDGLLAGCTPTAGSSCKSCSLTASKSCSCD